MAFADLNKRSLDIFKSLVDAYLEFGEPIGSRTISKRLEDALSPATIRNIMSDLEDAGLLYAPHTSAGRLPTDAGIQFFVQGLLEVGPLTERDCEQVRNACTLQGKNIEDVLEEATTLLSGLSNCTSLVLAPKMESSLKQIEFISLGGNKALVVIIMEDGMVENRIIEMDTPLSPEILTQATNYFTQRLTGKTFLEAKKIIEKEWAGYQEQLDDLASKVVKEGLAVWSGDSASRGLIIKGQSKLLQNVMMLEDVDRIRDLFNILDQKDHFIHLLDAIIQADGVQIFVGAQHPLFKVSGCTMIVAPYTNAKDQIIGAIGVLGPTRMNYSKVIPLVDYTARFVGKLLGNEDV